MYKLLILKFHLYHLKGLYLERRLAYNLCSFEFGKAVMYTRLGVHYGSLKDSDAFFGGEQLRRVARNGL